MRSPATLGAILALTLAAAPAAHAQGASGPRIGLEVNGGLSFPVGDGADAFDSGTALGANLLVELTPALGVYGGYSYEQIPYSTGDIDLTLQGFEGGVRFSPGLALGPLSPTLTLGATYLKPEVSGGPDADEEAERKLGYRAGIGFDVPLGQLLTASIGGSLVSHPFGDFPECPPSDPDCNPDTRVQATVGLRVYPPFLGRGPGR